MKWQKFFKSAFKTIAVLALCEILVSWGAWGHQHINHAAVFALPTPMKSFFYNHIDFITEESVVPDIRKYTINDKAEFARHYIDVESFDSNVDNIPQTWKEITAKYDSSFLQKNGILPWYIQDMMAKLTTAFKNKQKTEILFIASDLGHYLGDANMPLHTALNHDGQFTNQKGIHAFWESQLPELFGDNYNFKVDSAKYISDIKAETWRIIKASHNLEEQLLSTEKKLSANFAANKIYELDSAGKIVKNRYGQPVHTIEYAEAYHKALNGMVEKQVREAIQDIANFWYTAWVNAGKPDLRNIDPASLTRKNRNEYKKDERLYNKGKISCLKINNEFKQTKK